MKLLVLTPEPIDAGLLRSTVGEDISDAEVMVVTPATQSSPLRFWMNDNDAEIAHAQEAADETVERLEEEGVDAVGDTGEVEPALALQDALAARVREDHDAVGGEGGERDYREDEGLRDAEGRFGIPVTFAEIGRELP
jgi:hypothetical protein